MSQECGYDGGDCLEFVQKYPNCKVPYPHWVGDGYCGGGKYMSPECGYDGGDCLEFLQKYPNCTVAFPDWVGNGRCNGGMRERSAPQLCLPHPHDS